MNAKQTLLFPGFTESAALAINDVRDMCHDLAKESGWWTDQESGLPLLEAAGKWAPHVVAGKIALIHSEASEALEGHRKGLMDDHLPDRKMLEVELADTLIRICDLAGVLDLDLGGAVMEKLAYNQKRPDHRPENREQEGGKKL